MANARHTSAPTPCRAPGATDLAPPMRRQAGMAMHKQVMGGRFCFRSDSEALLGLVEAAYGGHAPHRLPDEGAEIEVELHLSPNRTRMEGEPPAVRSRLDKDVLYGIIDAWNYVLVSPRRRRARGVASARSEEQHTSELQFLMPLS